MGEGPLRPLVEEWAENQPSNRWQVDFGNGIVRETGMDGLAWYADQCDDDATVTPL